MTINQTKLNKRSGELLKLLTLARGIKLSNIPGFAKARFLQCLMILSVIITSCDLDRDSTDWEEGDPLSISQFMEINKEEYSKFYRLLDKSKMLNTLYAYNPYGEDYTLFVPTDEAIDQFISTSNTYENFEELLADTTFIKRLVRYHTLNRKLHSDGFPDGALDDLTLTGERLVIGFYTEGSNQLIKVNKMAPIVKTNLTMTNGFIHVISGVLQKPELTGYDWLQQKEGYSILAQAVKLSGIKSSLYWSRYSILAEHDSIYRRNGINNVEDLIQRISTPGMSLINKSNAFYLFAAYHFFNGEYYLNDLNWGFKNYTTLAGKYLPIYVGAEIKINEGVDTYRHIVSKTGDTIAVDYILPFWEYSNMMTKTGPVHSISEMLFYEPLP